MYQVTVTEDFINVLYEVPLRYLPILTNSFVAIKKLSEEEIVPNENISVIEMLERLRTQNNEEV